MNKILLNLFLCLLSISMHAQNRTAKSIEQEIERYELKIEEKERSIARNTANGRTADNRALEKDIADYEAEIYLLLKELKKAQNTDRTEAAFMALQEEVDVCKEENQDLLAEIASLRKQLGNSGGSIPSRSKNVFIDPRDNETYQVVQIGNQVWMVENMRYNVRGSMLDSNNPSKAYGRLYTWEQAKVACPKGWHLPSDAEWKDLERSIGMSERDVNDSFGRGNVAGKLKDISVWGNSASASNSSGFTALPAGSAWLSSSFSGLGKSAFFWTSTAESLMGVYFRGLTKKDNEIIRGLHQATDNNSCRCIKD